ncbi:tape measure protein [Enterococcus xiangfangensis]|uniref:Tape measure protein n=1 Tax=Enterococcus xiangfangensis TaxID=1296537 RepID=A0ABU3F9B8_9ENTE|nr:tape measure protein [Enterococcus xiangfangensis]MDT2759266.1 tape measure protein [Enterococcus xiangfangensis]
MADDVKVGGAKLTITADSGPAEKAVASFFSWFEKTGEKATELASKISDVAEQAESLGKKGANSTKAMGTNYVDLKKRVNKTKESFNSTKKSIDDMTSSGTKGYQNLASKITNANSTLSANSKQTFNQMKNDAKVSYSEMTKDNKAMNKALVASMKSSLSNLKSSFSDLKNGFKTIGDSVLGLIRNPIDKVKAMPKTIQNAMKSVTGFVGSGFAQAKNQAISQIQQIPTKATQALNKTKDVFVTGFNSVVNSTASAVSRIGNGLAQLPSKVSKVAANIKTSFTNGIKDIPNRASNIWASVKNGIHSLPQTAMSAGSSIKNHLSNGFQTILSKAKSVFPGIKREVKEGVEEPSKSAKTAVTDLASTFGLVALASKAFGMIKESVGGAISRIDTLNNSTRAFGNMGFTAKETKKAMAGLQDGIQGLPTALDEAVSGLQLMTASTQDIGKSQKIFNAVNDSILGFGGNTEMVNNAILQMSQAFANGKMDAETWNSMMNSQMGPTLNAMAKEMGITTGELKSGLSEGAISVDRFQEALIKLDTEGGGGLKSLQKIAKDSTSGIGTSFQNMKTAIVRGTANVITAFDTFLKEVTGSNIAETLNAIGESAEKGFKKVEVVFKAITPATKKLFSILKPLMPIIKGVLAGLLAYGSLVTVISIITKLQSVLAAFFATAAANPFVLISAVIVGLIVVLKEAYKRSETFRKIIDTLAEPFKRLAKAIGIVSEALKTIFTEGPGEKLASLHKQLDEILPTEVVDQLWKRIANLKATFDQLTAIFSIAKKVLDGEVVSFKDVFDRFGEYFSVDQIKQIMHFIDKLNKVIEPLKQGITNLKLALDFQLNEKDYAGALEVIAQFIPAILSTVLGGIPGLIIAGGRLLLSIADGMGINIPELVSRLTTEVIPNILQTFLDASISFMNIGIQWINDIIVGINNWLPQLLPIASQIVSNLVTFLTTALPLIFQVGSKILFNIIDGIFQALPNLINIAIQIISWIASTIAQNLPIIFNKGLDIVLNLIQGILTKFPEWFGMAIKLIVQFGTKLAENFPTIVQKGWELLTKLIQGVGERIPQLLAMVVIFMGKMIAKIIEYLPDLIILGAKLIIGLIKGLWEFGEGLGRFVIGFWDSLKKGFSKVDWAEIGRNVIDGIVKGFTKGFDKAKKTVTDLAGNVGKWFSDKLDIHSPSRVMIGIAKWIPEGVAVGIEKGLPIVENAVSTMTDMMTKAVKDSEPIGLSSDVIATESYGMPDATQMQASAQQASKAGNQGMADSTPQLLQTALNAANGILGQFSSISPSMVTQGADWLTNFINGWNSVLPAMITSVQTFIIQYTILITNQNNPNYQMGRAWMQNKLNGWSSLISTFITTVRNFCNQVLNLLRSFYNAMFQTGRTWLQNLLNGWNSLYQSFINRVNQLGNDAINNLRSKSGGFNSAGRFLMQSLIDGINSMGGTLSATMNSVANKMVGGIGKGVNGVIGGVNFVLKEVESDKKLGNWAVPQYARGTDGHPADGPAVVNDQKGSKYQEIIQEPDGSTFIAKGRNALVWLKKGAKVLNATVSERILKAQNKFGSMIPKYEDGIGEFDIFDLIDDEGAFKKLVDQRVDYNSIMEPWRNMTKAGVKLMTGAAYPFAQKQVEDAYGGGSFDGAMNANNVYQYLVDIAQKVMSKFGGLTITSGYRPGDPHWHGKHQALDISGYPYGSPRYTEAANWAFEKFPKQIAYVITNGRVRDRVGMSGQAATGQWVPWPDNDHYDHIHLNGSLGAGSVYNAGTDVAGGLPTLGGSGVERWRSYLKKALRMNQLPTSQAYVNAWLSQIQSESRGNEKAIQPGADPDGDGSGPAIGLLQTKRGTFLANAFPGYGNIMKGFDNMLAAIRYAKNRYGANMLGVIGHGHGYENGGWITQDGLYRAGEKGKPEMVIPLTKPARAMQLIGQALNYMAKNGSGILQSATAGLSDIASNMTLNLADLVGVDTNSIRSNLSGSANMDLQEVIRLLSVNNQLLSEIRDQESYIVMDKEKVGKKVASTVAKENSRNERLSERRKGRV